MQRIQLSNRQSARTRFPSESRTMPVVEAAFCERGVSRRVAEGTLFAVLLASGTSALLCTIATSVQPQARTKAQCAKIALLRVSHGHAWLRGPS